MTTPPAAMTRHLLDPLGTPAVVANTVWVRRTFPQTAPIDPASNLPVPEFEESLLGVTRFESTPALVSASMGATLNVGNFESLRLDVGVTLPCYPEEVPEGVAAAAQFCADYLDTRRAELKALRTGAKRRERAAGSGASAD